MSGQFSDISQELESWYGRDRGQYLQEQIRSQVQPVLDTVFGYHLLQLSPCTNLPLYDSSPINHRIYASTHTGNKVGVISLEDELPLETDSVDAVIALHSLEFSENPHQVLRELQRVLTPQGHMLLIGFNPNSLTGVIRRLQGACGSDLWKEHCPVSENRLADWLYLLGCEVRERSRFYHVPPVGGGRVRHWLSAVDRWSEQHNFLSGGVYMIHAIKQVSALSRPRHQLRMKSERLIGLAVPKAGVAPSPTPKMPGQRPAALGRSPGPGTGDAAA